MIEGKGTLKHKSGKQFFVLIENVYNKKKTELKNNPIHFDLDENLDGETVSVHYTKSGRKIYVENIIHNERTFGKDSSRKVESKEQTYRHKYQSNNPLPNKSQSYSKTPYNFIPLNGEIITQEIHKENNYESVELLDLYKQNIYQKDQYAGTIKVSIKNETQLFIGSYKTSSKQKKLNGFKEIQPFTINKSPAIPGSTLRGLLYSIFEIVSYSPMVNMEDAPVYFRSTMPEFKNGKNLRFGLLSFQHGIPKIYDLNNSVKKLDWRKYSHPLTIIDDQNYLGLSSGKIMGKVHSFGISKTNLSINNCDEYTGESLEKVIRDYKSDKSRDPSIDNILNILKLAASYKIEKLCITGCPVWFTVKEGDVASIGHAKYHRIPADARSINMLPENHRNHYEKRKTDYRKNPYRLSLPEILFGNSESHSSKIRISDALSDNAQIEDCPKLLIKTLQSPKIKSANLYLRSEVGKPDWQNPTNDQIIRGFKQYFHKSSEYKWHEPIVEQTEFREIAEYKKKLQQQKNLQSLIRPIKPDGNFHSTIHFSNLTDIELGALLFLLNLPDDLRYSIGMGKPYGMGRIKIGVESLVLLNVKNRYSSEHLATDSMVRLNEFNEFIQAFENFVLERIGEKEKKSLWELDRLQNLKGLMKIQGAINDQKSEYMEDYRPFAKGYPVIDDPLNLSEYNLTRDRQFLKK